MALVGAGDRGPQVADRRERRQRQHEHRPTHESPGQPRERVAGPAQDDDTNHHRTVALVRRSADGPDGVTTTFARKARMQSGYVSLTAFLPADDRLTVAKRAATIATDGLG
jgi:hypothetical protein